MDSLWWQVHVVELYIRSFDPPMTSLRPVRDEEVVFSLDVRSLEDRRLTYRWTLDSALVSDGDAFLLEPLAEFTPHSLTAVVSNGNAADSVSWSITLRSLFRSWQPEGVLISTAVGSTVRFAAALDGDLPEDAHIYWFTGEELMAEDTLAVEIEFPTEGRTRVKCEVRNDDEDLLEDIRRTVNVTPLGVSGNKSFQPATAILSVQPNPFNSRTTVRYSVEQSSPVQLRIFDHTGREVARLVEGQVEAGSYEFSFEAADLPAGIYFAILDAAGERKVMKMALIR